MPQIKPGDHMLSFRSLAHIFTDFSAWLGMFILCPTPKTSPSPSSPLSPAPNNPPRCLWPHVGVSQSRSRFRYIEQVECRSSPHKPLVFAPTSDSISFSAAKPIISRSKSASRSSQRASEGPSCLWSSVDFPTGCAWTTQPYRKIPMPPYRPTPPLGTRIPRRHCY